ncbi:hypothetical protein CBS101457_006470 [Exobasidium rhododendri]|nr:hypothetical protein CBS101457_006470 [Exobasidium rhododendri]
MGDSGYRGVSADQDGRYRNKEQALLKKLASSGQFPAQFGEKVLMTKVNLEVIKPWIAEKVEELLGFEDDVVVEYINGMLEDPDNRQPDPKKMQLSLTGFLESKTPSFMAELWRLLLSAQKSLGGIPQEFVEKKKQEMREAREKDSSAIMGSGAVHDYRAQGTSRPEGSSLRGRGGGGGRGRGRGGGDRSNRFNDREFRDKNGNTTERVQDGGWGARQGPRGEELRRSDPYPPRRGYDEGDRYDNRSRGRYYDDQRKYDDDYTRRTSRSPARVANRSVTPELGRDESTRESKRHKERSITPDWRMRRRRDRSRSYSRSYSPPPRRKARAASSRSPRPLPPSSRRVRKRNSSGSVSPTPRRKVSHRRESHSNSPSSRSRSPPLRRVSRQRSTSRSRGRSSSSGYSSSRRSASPPPPQRKDTLK